MDVVLVVAAADNGVIGKDGRMPWHIPADLKRFKQMTVGKPVVMGRKTFDSIGRPLPGRHNIVLTRQPGWHADGVTTVGNLAEAIAAAGLDPRIRPEQLMVIGGGEIYRLAMPIATHVALTRVHATPDGDAWFPEPDPAQWVEVARESHPGYSYVTLVRR